VEWGPELEQLFEPEDAAASASASEQPQPVLVSDMSSSFMSRPVEVARYGLIYAGAQKNVGPAGLTMVIVRNSLLRPRGTNAPAAPAASSSSSSVFQPSTPLMLQYALQAEKGSMYNTPPCWSIYVTGLVFKYLLAQGGLSKVQQLNEKKAQLLYAVIDNSNGFYRFVQPHSTQIAARACLQRCRIVFPARAAHFVLRCYVPASSLFSCSPQCLRVRRASLSHECGVHGECRWLVTPCTRRQAQCALRGRVGEAGHHRTGGTPVRVQRASTTPRGTQTE